MIAIKKYSFQPLLFEIYNKTFYTLFCPFGHIWLCKCKCTAQDCLLCLALAQTEPFEWGETRVSLSMLPRFAKFLVSTCAQIKFSQIQRWYCADLFFKTIKKSKQVFEFEKNCLNPTYSLSESFLHSFLSVIVWTDTTRRWQKYRRTWNLK